MLYYYGQEGSQAEERASKHAREKNSLCPLHRAAISFVTRFCSVATILLKTLDEVAVHCCTTMYPFKRRSGATHITSDCVDCCFHCHAIASHKFPYWKLSFLKLRPLTHTVLATFSRAVDTCQNGLAFNNMLLHLTGPKACSIEARQRRWQKRSRYVFTMPHQSRVPPLLS